MLAGRLSDENKNVMQFPDGLTYLNQPYFEGSIGVENILKLFRIDATWRFSYRDHPDIQTFGLRVMMQLIF